MKNYFLYIFIILVIVSQAQQGFQINISSDNDEIFYSVAEDLEGNYVFVGTIREIFPSYHKLSPYFAKISQNGDIIRETVIEADTINLNLYQVIPLDNGNYLFAGKKGDTLSGNYKYIYTLLTDSSFKVLKTNQYHIPDIYTNIYYKQTYIKEDNGEFIICGKLIYYDTNGDMFLCRIDNEARILDFQNYIYPGHNQHPIGITKKENSDIYNIIGTSFYAYGPIEILEIDTSFEVQNNQILNTMVSISESRTIQKFTDSTFILGGRYSTMNPNDQNLMVVEFDTNQVIYNEVILGRDSVPEYPAWNKCIDFYDKNDIYVSGFRGGAWWYPYRDYVQIWLLDSCLNLKAYKYFGGDANYHVRSILATSDKGCIAVATRYIESYGDQRDIFIIKVFEDELISSVNEITDLYDKKAIIYPNPGSEYLIINNSQKNTDFKLYNSQGIVVIQKNSITENMAKVNTQHLPEGIYYYSIKENSEIIQKGKWIKSQ
ncbi:MAG: T9SS type A sorting domain-containing protein [Bacteroidales bacterium]|nr:T9SS type A sorting domain-containing protein [Bacteroidales bacterium]